MTTTIVVDGQRLSHAISYMTGATPEGHCSLIAATADPPPAGVLFFKAMDTAGISIVECKLKCAYEGDLVDLAFGYGDIPTDLSGPTTLTVDPKLNVQAGRVRYPITLLEPRYIKKVQSINVQWPLIFDCAMSELQVGLKAVCSKIAKKDTNVSVMLSWEHNQLIIEDSEQTRAAATYEASELNIRQPFDGILETRLPTDYVREMLTPLSRLDRCIVAMGNEIPISIGGTTADGLLGCGLIIAPRIDPK